MGRGLAKRRLLASAAGAALAAGCGAFPAFAQSFSWTGFYTGGYVGSSWGKTDATSTIPCTTAASPPAYLCGATANSASAAVGANGSGSAVSAHFTGGVQAGYNLQVGIFVYGAEMDFGAFNVKRSASATANYLSTVLAPAVTNRYTIGTSVESDWLFTLRGRAGFALANALLYATGGLAVTRLAATNTFSDNFATGGSTGAIGGGAFSGNRVGWTAGGGLEWAFVRAWSVKIEYLYVDFGSITVLGQIRNAGYSQGLNTSFDVTAHVARAGFNFRF